MKEKSDKQAIIVFDITLCVLMLLVAWCIIDAAYDTLWMYSILIFTMALFRDRLIKRNK